MRALISVSKSEKSPLPFKSTLQTILYTYICPIVLFPTVLVHLLSTNPTTIRLWWIDQLVMAIHKDRLGQVPVRYKIFDC